MKLNRFLRAKWYYLSCLFWHRYHVVKCKKLAPTWHDRDEIILHTAFQCLEDFIEKEEPWEFLATKEKMQEAYGEFDPGRIHSWNEIRDLYMWWADYRTCIFDEEKNRQEEDCNLHRLINVRRYLWT